jgi:stage II sporulation protein D
MKAVLLALLLTTLLPTASLPAAPLKLRIQDTANHHIIELPLETYVAAVLAGESGVFHSPEALKAMAVAARTYAVRMRGRHAAEGFDLCDTTHCQRMLLSAVTPRLENAAAETAGELLWYQGRPALTVYTQSCGGRTEPDPSEPYLTSHADPWCPRSPWAWTSDLPQIADALRHSSLAAPDHLARVSILDRTPTGRAATLLLSGAQTLRIDAGSFRLALGRDIGWNTLRSDRYEIHAVNGRITFEGSGFGNGVGLCQLGADAMGRAGKTYREILAFYYPGTALGLNAQGIRWQQLSGETITLFTTRPDTDRPALAAAERIARAISQRTGWPIPPNTEIRAYPDLDTYRDSTGEPGWVVGYTMGRTIHLQPVASLRAKGLLEATMSHEMVHVLMEAQAAPRLPLWFREGLADALADLAAPHPGAPGVIPPASEFRQTQDPTRARRAYAEAHAEVARLIRVYGETTVLGWVSRGLPPEVANANSSHAPPKSR